MKDLAIIEGLRAEGFRITRIRKATIGIISMSTEPLSVSALSSALLKKDISANKTTLYRELDFLKKKEIIKEIEFGDGKKRYELSTDTHHHHIVCVRCATVADIDFDVDLETHEKEISRQSGFKIENHSIEFFGLCSLCQKKEVPNL